MSENEARLLRWCDISFFYQKKPQQNTVDFLKFIQISGVFDYILNIQFVEYSNYTLLHLRQKKGNNSFLTLIFEIINNLKFSCHSWSLCVEKLLHPFQMRHTVLFLTLADLRVSQLKDYISSIGYLK